WRDCQNVSRSIRKCQERLHVTAFSSKFHHKLKGSGRNLNTPSEQGLPRLRATREIVGFQFDPTLFVVAKLACEVNRKVGHSTAGQRYSNDFAVRLAVRPAPTPIKE